jgi:excisionase family DNA binding protein
MIDNMLMGILSPRMARVDTGHVETILNVAGRRDASHNIQLVKGATPFVGKMPSAKSRPDERDARGYEDALSGMHAVERQRSGRGDFCLSGVSCCSGNIRSPPKRMRRGMTTLENRPTIETRTLTMTIEEAAKAFGISRGNAYAAARRDELPIPVIRIGRRMLVSRIAVETVLQRLKNDSGESAVA